MGCGLSAMTGLVLSGVVWCRLVLSGVVWSGLVWSGVLLSGVVWCGVVLSAGHSVVAYCLSGGSQIITPVPIPTKITVFNLVLPFDLTQRGYRMSAARREFVNQVVAALLNKLATRDIVFVHVR